MRRNALSLVEVIVVIAILGLLIAILLPAVMAARESARRIECTNKLKQIGVGIQGYVTKAGELPVGSLSPHALILPYLEQGNLYHTVNFKIQDMIATENATARSTTVSAFLPTLFVDGHVSFIKSSISRAHWRGLGTISGGEVTSEVD